MSYLRIFRKASHAVQLPRLPREVVILVISINTLSFLALSPPILGEWIKRTMIETVEAAVAISQFTGAQDMPAQRTENEIIALRFSGINIVEQANKPPQQIWLVDTPTPQPSVGTIDLTNAGVFDGIGNLFWMMTRPANAQFELYHAPSNPDSALYVVASFDVWQQYTLGLVLRFLFAFILLCVFFAAFFGIFFNRLVLQSLDDLFARLYGSAAMGATDEQDTQSLLADLAAFQDRMRLHIDEQARLAALGAGASFLAHDIRNLLASLQLNAEQLMQLPGEKEQRIGQRLATAIEQSLSLVEWAALYTSNKRDHLDVQRQPLRPIIDDALNFVRLHDPRRRVQLVNDCLGNVEVVAERTLMFRILYNLALNAVQAMKGQASFCQIRIRASHDEQACIIRVSDSGPGLPDKGRGPLLMPHMAGARQPDGTGLGLKIVADLVSWHGGHLDIIHSDGHGTQFQITLPHRAPGAPRDEADGANMASIDPPKSLPANA